MNNPIEIRQRVAAILKYDGYAISLFEEGKFLKAANSLLLFNAHGIAANLRELAKAMARAKKVQAREMKQAAKDAARKRPQAADKKNNAQYRRMMAAYMRWRTNKSPERRAEYEACRAVWRTEFHIRAYHKKS